MPILGVFSRYEEVLLLRHRRTSSCRLNAAKRFLQIARGSYCKAVYKAKPATAKEVKMEREAEIKARHERRRLAMQDSTIASTPAAYSDDVIAAADPITVRSGAGDNPAEVSQSESQQSFFVSGVDTSGPAAALDVVAASVPIDDLVPVIRELAGDDPAELDQYSENQQSILVASEGASGRTTSTSGLDNEVADLSMTVREGGDDAAEINLYSEIQQSNFVPRVDISEAVDGTEHIPRAKQALEESVWQCIYAVFSYEEDSSVKYHLQDLMDMDEETLPLFATTLGVDDVNRDPTDVKILRNNIVKELSSRNQLVTSTSSDKAGAVRRLSMAHLTNVVEAELAKLLIFYMAVPGSRGSEIRQIRSAKAFVEACSEMFVEAMEGSAAPVYEPRTTFRALNLAAAMLDRLCQRPGSPLFTRGRISRRG
ncbi:hypothetical protein GOP47_0002728 [Adiantum capillus-veneris]|uniref:Uncharacterized protein n=1 Tax=Adiantum capillus-veneris TaxID=13818 RepID=A0A9D4VBH2_ADICA|nr:hypothetical protein GOP47_0002728 [Adiantum capillus-veneris]